MMILFLPAVTAASYIVEQPGSASRDAQFCCGGPLRAIEAEYSQSHERLVSGLKGHFKTGHMWSLQNRPYELIQNGGSFTCRLARRQG
jgi:hypothetical protein